MMTKLFFLVLAMISISSCNLPFSLRGLPLVDPVIEVVVAQNTTTDLDVTATVHVNTSTAMPINGIFEFEWVIYPTAVSYYSFANSQGV